MNTFWAGFPGKCIDDDDLGFLSTLQMATEYIMIIIFELIYDIHHSTIIDYKYKLAIYAKHVWHSIDPGPPIGDPTEQKRIITRAA